MSNQVGLILSFIFLSFFIIFSGETIAYQTMSAQCLSKTNNIAIYIQKYGYESNDHNLSMLLEDFDKYEISQNDKSDGFISYTIKTYDTYTPFSELFDYFSCQITER